MHVNKLNKPFFCLLNSIVEGLAHGMSLAEMTHSVDNP